MMRAGFAAMIVSGAMITGCVSSATHEQTVSELNWARVALESLKTQAAETESLQRRLEATQKELADAKQALDTERTTELESESAKASVAPAQEEQATSVLWASIFFDSGQDQISPDGIVILKQVSEQLRDVKDKRIRIEGHTDNVPVGEGLGERFLTNWELSSARAAGVVHYLIEEGGVDPSLLSAVGYADTKPIASNDSAEGRKANRRIEIMVHPMEFADAAGG